MSMRLSVLLEICIFLLHTRFDLALGEYFEECDGVENETYIASPSNCSAYIYCNDADSLLGYCDAGEYFLAKESVCDYKENVYCALDAVDESEEIDNENVDETTKETTANGEEELTIENTPPTMATTIDPLTIPSIIKDKCPKTDDPNQIVFIPNSQSCADYYVCYHGNAIVMHCSNNLHFNMHTGKCDFPENVQCLNDRPNANKCLPYVTDFFPHPENCNYFYYCIRGFMTIQQCPFYYGWDIERRTCVNISKAKCFSNNETTIIS